MLNKTIFPITAILSAILSIAAATTADAKPRHQQSERASPALIECDMRGCSDRVVAFRAARPAATAAVRPKVNQQPPPRVRAGEVTITCDMHGCSDRAAVARIVATARPEATSAMSAMAAVPRRVSQYRAARTSHAEIICDQRGCSDRVVPGSAGSQRIVDANGNSAGAIIIGGRPPGCPHRFCGCEASLYLFGKIHPELNLAYNWIRKFPRTQPSPGMVAARSGHVMVLISHAGGNDWLVHDGNSGGGLTRRHVMSINRYVIVDPQGTRSAER